MFPVAKRELDQGMNCIFYDLSLAHTTYFVESLSLQGCRITRLAES
jgi:hypothetical protein